MIQIVRRPRKRKPMEFSKKILILSYFAAGTAFIYAMWIQYMMMTRDFHGDVGIVITLLTGAGAMITSGQAFYTWKSRSENIAKICNNPDYLRAEDTDYNEGDDIL